MRTIFLFRWVLLLACCPFFIQAQSFTTDFEGTACPGSPCGGYIDNLDCLTDWKSSHGTPQISSSSCFGNDALLLIARNDEKGGWGAEGAFWNLPNALLSSNCYVIRFYTKRSGSTNSNVNLQLSLTNNLTFGNVPPPSGACVEPNLTNPEQIFFNVPSTNLSTSCTLQEFIVTPSQNYSQIWAKSWLAASPSGSSVDLFIDDISIEAPDQSLADFTIDPSSGPICTGESIQFTSTFTGNVNHSWNFGDGSNSTLANPSHSYSSENTYTVSHTVSDGNGCFSFTSTQQITVLKAGNADFQFSIGEPTCEGTEVCFTNLSTGEVTGFSWIFGDGSPFDSQNENPCHTYDEAGDYLVILSVVDVCGNVDIFSITVSVPGLPYDADISGNQTISGLEGSLTIPVGSASNALWRVDGTLTIDQDYTFGNNLEIELQPGAVIIVNPDVTLTMDHAYLHGCEQLWQGIRLLSASTGNINGAILAADNSTIEDAEFAIRPFNKTTLDVVNTTFNKNFVGIFYEDPTGFYIESPFYGNAFLCTDVLLPPYPGQLTNPGTFAFAGMEIYGQILLNIGVGGQNINRFVGLANGIIAENTSLDIRSTAFISMLTPGEYGVEGFGINSVGTDPGFTLRLVGLGLETPSFTPPRTFNNCRTAIFTENLRIANITNAQMENLISGVIAMNSNTDVRIRLNQIQAGAQGIGLSNWDPFTDIDIRQNEILMDGVSNGIGIRLNAIGIPPTSGSILVQENTIDLEMSKSIGISCANISFAEIRENTINSSTPSLSDTRGIYLQYCEESTLCGNVMNGNGNFTGMSNNIGLYLNSSTSQLIQCNTMDNWLQGMYVIGTCTATDAVKGNVFGAADEGLVIEDNSSIGEQTDLPEAKGNRWEGPFQSWAAKHNESVDLNFILGSRFTVNSNTTPLFPNPIFVGIGGVLDFFSPGTTGNPVFFCNENDPCGFPESEELLLNSTEQNIIAGVLYNESSPTGYQQIAYQRLLLKLLDHPSLYQNNLAALDFLNAQSTQEAGQFAEVFKAMKDGWTFAPDLGDELLYYNAAIDVLLDSIIIQDSLQLAEDNGAVWLPQRRVLIESLLTEIQAVQEKWEDIWTERSQNWEGVANQNQSIDTEEAVYSDLQWIYNLLLASAYTNQYQFTPDEVANLEQIAAICVPEGGLATFLARGILEIKDGRYPDYQENCDLEENTLEEDSSMGAKRLYLQPNPATDQLLIRFSEELEAQELCVYAPTGALLFRKEISNGATMHSLNVEVLPAGLYYIRVFDKNKLSIASQAFIKQ